MQEGSHQGAHHLGGQAGGLGGLGWRSLPGPRASLSGPAGLREARAGDHSSEQAQSPVRSHGGGVVARSTALRCPVERLNPLVAAA